LNNKINNKTNNLHQERQTLKHKYTKYYPSIYDPDFSHKIAKHGIFKKYKLTVNQKRLNDLYNAFETNIPMPEDSKKHDTNIYILKPFQKMLRNFMSPYTPYRSILIYHEMGVGKTCTAITIAESLKNIVKNSDSKIYVIRPDEIERQIFDVNVVHERKPLNQCTGDTYLQNPRFADLIKNCMGGNDNSCEQLKTKVSKEIRNVYEFAGSQLWARKVQSEIDFKTRNVEDPKIIEEKTKAVVQNMFNNSVIIVDEAHELRDSNEKDVKIVPPILNKVLKHALNLRLIFLSATPIYDKPQNIVSLINYFLLNDKRQLMKESEVFDLDGNLKPSGRGILERNTVGYISYLRGSNPYDFPIRISAKYNIPNKLVDLDNYPLKDINSRKLNKNDKIKHLELVDCKIGGAQLEILNYHVKYDKIPDLNEDDMDKLSSIEPVFDTLLTDIEEYEDQDDQDDQDNQDNQDDITQKSKMSKISKISKISIIPKQKQSTRDEYREKTVAYLFERQISNIVYQTLDECSNNIKLAVGDLGLSQIVKKQPGKWTYEFTDPKYAKRFKLPELYNWGAKIAQAVELAIQSTGPVFIYTYFNSAGVIPLAFALEMNGFKRYKQHGTPLLETQEKDRTYRGDYIIYTGKQSLSAYAKEYIDKRRKMIYETSVKVFIGSSKASEGLNLFGYREAHILDPWHNINLTEQSIGRVIRTGSHIHLPPQERNVTVYQYAATLGDRESIDLKIYKICEGKAIKAGVIEKILKENALDCELNKDVNIYDSVYYNRVIPLKTSHNKQITVRLADTEYSRSCFYMKNCSFSCNRATDDKHHKHHKDHSEFDENAMPIMKFNYDKEVDEYKNLIIQLLSTSFNIKINNLRQYLKKLIYGEQITQDINVSKKLKITKKTKKQDQIQSQELPNKSVQEQVQDNTNWEDEDAFTSAIEEIINNDIPIKDKFGRDGKIILSGDYLRFIPKGSLEPNISIQKQNMKSPLLKAEIDLKGFITKINEEQKRLIETENLNYNEILHNTIEIIEKIFYGVYQKEYKFNVKLKLEEIIEIIFSKLVYAYKLTILKNILEKMVHGNKLNDNERKFENVIKKHIVYMKAVFPDTKQETDIKKNIYGFIIQNENKLELYILNSNKEFEKNQGNLRKIIEHHRKTMNKPPNKLYGYLKYEKGRDYPIFKITDITKGEKKSLIGTTCITKTTHDIKKNINKLDEKILKDKNVLINKNVLCNDIELIMKRNDAINLDGKKWYYTPEEYEIYFGSQS
jgi:hypothetical protein